MIDNIYEEALGRTDFQDYQHFENINDAYSVFIQKIIGVIVLVAPITSRWMKQNSQEGFDDEVVEKSVHNKLFSNYIIVQKNMQKICISAKKYLYSSK